MQPGSGPQQAHRPRINFVPQGLEAFVFGRPGLNLREQVLRPLEGAAAKVKKKLARRCPASNEGAKPAAWCLPYRRGSLARAP